MKKIYFSLFIVGTISVAFFLKYRASNITELSSLSAEKQASTQYGISKDELNKFYSITEGSDIFPYDWLIRLKSAYERDRTMNWERGFFDSLESRTNAIKNPNKTKYLIDYIGLSTSWSSQHPLKTDAFKNEESESDLMGKIPKVRWVNGVPSTRMVGVNCAFCHTGYIKTELGKKIIDGGQAEVNLQRLYGDMVISSLALIINFEDVLDNFLQQFGYDQNESKKIAKEFAIETLKNAKLGTKIKLILKSINIIKEPTPWFLEKEVLNVAERYKALFRITHRLEKDYDLGNELNKRFEYLARFSQGAPKKTTQGGSLENPIRFHSSKDGFGRLEAFISAGNRVFRDREDWVSSDAAVGFPSIWDISKKSVYHYTANTNSLLVRNIGQAMGLGALFLDDNGDSTVNMHNLAELEELAGKIPYPDWNKVFAEDAKKDESFVIDLEKVQRGKQIYQQNCATCHSPNLVGPQKNLVEYKVYSVDEIGTDKNLAINIVKPVNERIGYADLFGKTGEKMISFYKNKYGVDNKIIANWIGTEQRGKPWIRDTYSQKIQEQGRQENYSQIQPQAGYQARDLKGVWATAPYLHNNSVPTLRDLLEVDTKRPQIFERGINYFDPVKVGLKQRYEYDKDKSSLILPISRKNKVEEVVSQFKIKNCHYKKGNTEETVWATDVCFDVKESGNSNKGHNYGVDLKEYEKQDLIEFLKVY